MQEDNKGAQMLVAMIGEQQIEIRALRMALQQTQLELAQVKTANQIMAMSESDVKQEQADG